MPGGLLDIQEVSEVPGEHFCTHCEDNVSKHKGTYTKLYFDNFDPDEDEIINVVCPACRKKDKDLNKVLTVLEDVSKPVETFKGARKCIFCRERIKKKEKSLRAEFRYNGSETRSDICEKCLEDEDHPILKDAKPKKANPNFVIDLNCRSAHICENYKEPKKTRGINCQNVCVNLEGELYCRKAHPGSVKVYRERYAFPPSRRQLMKMLTFLGPLSEKLNKTQLLAEETSVGPRDVTVFPDTVEYEIKEFPVDGGRVLLPWNANIINIEDQIMTVLVAVEKKKDEE